MFWKGTFAIGENDPFFVTFSSVPFAHRGLESGDSAKKFYLLFVALGNTIIEKTREYFREYSKATTRSELVSGH